MREIEIREVSQGMEIILAKSKRLLGYIFRVLFWFIPAIRVIFGKSSDGAWDTSFLSVLFGVLTPMILIIYMCLSTLPNEPFLRGAMIATPLVMFVSFGCFYHFRLKKLFGIPKWGPKTKRTS